MKFSTREDIEAPIDYVFARTTDFNGFERRALRREADVQRLDGSSVIQQGSAWDIAFKFRGKDRKMRATIVNLDQPTLVRFGITANGIEGDTVMELLALSRNRTRLSVTIDLTPKSLSARLLLQSLKLAKNNLTRKFKLRVSEFAEVIEDSYGKQS